VNALHIPVLLFAALVWATLAVSCEARSGPGQLEYDTPEGDEVAVSCPVDIPLDPTVLAEILDEPNVKTPVTPGYWITPVPRETAVPAGSLGALFPADPISGQLLGDGCAPASNAEVGSPFGGFFASEAELDRLGRLCGCNVLAGGEDVWLDYFKLRADLYLTTAGAREAFRMETQTLRRGFEDIRDVDQARLAGLGDERTIRLNVHSINGQRAEGQKVLLVRWHNIIARVELSPYKPTQLLLDYAEQLGRNIEAMTSGSGG